MANAKIKRARRPPINPSDLVLELDGEAFPPLPQKLSDVSCPLISGKAKATLPPTPVLLAPSSSKNSFASVSRPNSTPSLGLKLKFIENKDLEGKVRFQEKDCLNLEEQWGFALIGYIGGRFPGIKALREEAAKWKVKVKIHLHPSEWIIFKFLSEADRTKVVNGGPYRIFNRPLLIRDMPREFTFGDDLLFKVPIWIQFPNLPIDYWTDEGLSKIGSMIGNPLASDSLTRSREHLAYARILVEIDISKDLKSLPESLPLVTTDGKDFDQKVCYELIPYFCDHCKVVGHDIKHCSLILSKNETETTPEEKSEKTIGEEKLPDVAGSMDAGAGAVGKESRRDLGVVGAPGPWEIVRRKRTSATVVAGAGGESIGEGDLPSQPVDSVVEEGQHPKGILSPLGKSDSDTCKLGSPSTPTSSNRPAAMQITANRQANRMVSARADGQEPLRETSPAVSLLGGNSQLTKEPITLPKDIGPPSLGLNDIKSIGPEHQPTSQSSSQSAQSPPPSARKPKAMMYSPLKVSRFLSPLKARIPPKCSKPTQKKKLRAQSLPKARELSLVDDLDPEDTIADSIIVAINGAPHEAHSDKEHSKNDEDARGRPRNRFTPLKSKKPKRKGPVPSSNS